MKSIFDVLKDITHLKPTYQLTPSDEFAPYMVQRWLSFIHPTFCNLINSVYNDKINAFSDNQQLYDFLKCIIPKKTINKINYIKKAKNVEDSKHEGIIEELANSLELPKREVRTMISLFPEIALELKESDRILKKN